MTDDTDTYLSAQPNIVSGASPSQNGHHSELRLPNKADASAIHRLIEQCPPLDLNSIYTYLLLSEHFRQTCVLAEGPQGPDGFISAYIPPGKPDVLFVWQVAVHERARGRSLGRRMLLDLLARLQLSHIRYIETTVGPENAASRGMFAGLARHLHADVSESALFDSHLFGDACHDDERLIRIGPLRLPPPDI
ncbi:diaminobutyrate acetyltransferase [Pusillimonas noertemannii]|uniref:L-2,4-diaminobutyric acid acetyltransferase n=1 Tax=Pusillimonas noertemannii TaxID=305977 RepID=A0A2U1CKG4_9BURK|nr:diaminobutyrate acetyltransferase [Pusillimonas noertemannii]NYT69579.1 diaminobutyrate acetyltransferase [Pusillimonas noertemannii]PVY61497.1 diaminobutyrate acetyltransferase [Pusillimonas noertemannii]TFL08912.1 diaminobutyrate acetyltransferase [Pusillimonas noertemannii]